MIISKSLEAVFCDPAVVPLALDKRICIHCRTIRESY